MFFPSPPYKCLAKTIAANMAMHEIHHGDHAGTHSANSAPVTGAERSPIHGLCVWPRRRSMADSKISAKKIASAICASTPKPKYHTCDHARDERDQHVAHH